MIHCRFLSGAHPPKSQNQQPLPTRKKRFLTPAEKQMVTALFGQAIDLDKVGIYARKWLPLQHQHIAMTPFGQIYFPSQHHQPDFSQASVAYQYWFMHEMVHVWQYQMGMHVAWRGLGSFLARYHYDLQPRRLLSEFGMEQQACIIADYFALTTHGESAWRKLTRQNAIPEDQYSVNWPSLYQFTLMLFLTQPTHTKVLFG